MIVTAHQIPFKPNTGINKAANGKRKKLNPTDTIADGNVIPKPHNNPEVVISKHINNCE